MASWACEFEVTSCGAGRGAGSNFLVLLLLVSHMFLHAEWMHERATKHEVFAPLEGAL